jgi:hypothetical protein
LSVSAFFVRGVPAGRNLCLDRLSPQAIAEKDIMPRIRRDTSVFSFGLIVFLFSLGMLCAAENQPAPQPSDTTQTVEPLGASDRLEIELAE